MRLIDADHFERVLMAMPDDELCEDCCYNVVNKLDEAPTIEAEPVVHGRWIKQKDGTLDCSACRSTAPYKEDWYGEVIEAPVYPRCPYCGAIMDGGGSK